MSHERFTRRPVKNVEPVITDGITPRIGVFLYDLQYILPLEATILRYTFTSQPTLNSNLDIFPSFFLKVSLHTCVGASLRILPWSSTVFLKVGRGNILVRHEDSKLFSRSKEP